MLVLWVWYFFDSALLALKPSLSLFLLFIHIWSITHAFQQLFQRLQNPLAYITILQFYKITQFYFSLFFFPSIYLPFVFFFSFFTLPPSTSYSSFFYNSTQASLVIFFSLPFKFVGGWDQGPRVRLSEANSQKARS